MRITSRTKVVALLGDPVSHSLSPLLQNGWIADHDIDACYVAMRIDQMRADGLFENLNAVGLFGANVTAPHKDRAFRAANLSDPMAERLRAANTLVWEADQSIRALNTDVYGLIAALEEGAPDWRVRTRSACVLGAGGAARAGVAAMLETGISDIRILNRTLTRADDLSREIGGVAFDWTRARDALSGADVIINSTSAALGDDAVLRDLPLSLAAPGAVAFDMMYGKPSRFLEAAAAVGHVAIDGLGMLIHQGALSFELWFGVKPNVEKAGAILRAHLAQNA